jgi:hypothetical protein
MEERYIIVSISIPLFIFSLVALSIMYARVKEMKPDKRRSTYYALIGAFIFALSSLFFFLLTQISWIWIFFLLILYFSGLGILHHYMSSKIIPWTKRAHLFWVFLYALVVAAIGTIGYLWGYYFLSKHGFNWAFLMAGSFFFLPTFIVHAFNALHEIPKREYKKWYYPIGQAIDDPTDRELEAPFVISFEFEKKFDDTNVTSFRAKAPRYMKFGRLFYFFINDYNSRHAESKIEYVYDKSKPYGWVFYKKPDWYESVNYINSDETIADNRIEENSVIVCKRIMD